MSFEIPYLEDAYIEEAANKILEKYHGSRTIPVPIETIVEVDLGIRVYPFPTLHVNHRLNAFMTGDRKIIFVDQRQYGQYVEKCRFSIAHELGHYVLHWKYHDALPYTDIVSYLDWRASLDRKVVDRFETQSGLFAGFVLMPTEELLGVCKRVVAEYRGELKGLRIDPWPYIANEIAEVFEVSPKSALVRIRTGDIPSRIHLL